MKLKGKNSKKIPKEQKKKMEKTLKRMKKVREDDSMYLRDEMQKKLMWLNAERQKGVNGVKAIDAQKANLENQKQTLIKQILKIDGAIITLKDILDPKKESKEDKC